MTSVPPLTQAVERARLLAAAGDLEGARLALAHAVEREHGRLGDDHPEVLAARLHLAAVCRRLGDPVAARRVLEEAYEAGHRRHGDASLIMLRVSYDLGQVAEELGNRHEARKAFGRVAGHGPAALGVRHEAVARARAYLADFPVRAEAPPPRQDEKPSPRQDEKPPPRQDATPPPRQDATPSPHGTDLNQEHGTYPDSTGGTPESPAPRTWVMRTPREHSDLVRQATAMLHAYPGMGPTRQAAQAKGRSFAILLLMLAVIAAFAGIAALTLDLMGQAH